MGGSVVGREAEVRAIDDVLAAGRSGLAALVLEGEPGIGKTTLWREGIARAAEKGYRVLSCRAAAAEARLSFTALSDLLAPLEPEAFEPLPEPQRRALDAALLKAEHEEPAPDPRAIGAAVVSVFSRLAADEAVLVAVDDVQWLDPPSVRALEFALRRLGGQPLAFLATLRLGEPGRKGAILEAFPKETLRWLRLGPLSLGALHRIVEVELGYAVPRPLLARIERATGGNPFTPWRSSGRLGPRESRRRARPSPCPRTSARFSPHAFGGSPGGPGTLF
jgi:predicted ATPase